MRADRTRATSRRDASGPRCQSTAPLWRTAFAWPWGAEAGRLASVREKSVSKESIRGAGHNGQFENGPRGLRTDHRTRIATSRNANSGKPIRGRPIVAARSSHGVEGSLGWASSRRPYNALALTHRLHRARGRCRPEVWMHHPLIHAHRPRPVERPPGFDVGFLGTLTRRSFVAGMPGEFAPFDASTFTPDYPAFDEEYFEWIALLEAVAEAREQFVFIECGAGYGRWCVRAALAARHLNFHCTAVEAEPTHCHWIGEHLADNGIDPADHEIIWAALAARPGFVPFAIGRSDAWYGQAIRKRDPEPFPDARAR